MINCHINLKASCLSQTFFQVAAENVCALTLIIIKQKVKIIDFQTICNSIDHVYCLLLQHVILTAQ